VVDTRATPLTQAEIDRYHADGYLAPFRFLSAQTAQMIRGAIEDHITGRIASERYELTDPVVVREVDDANGKVRYEYDESVHSEKTHTFPFLFNMWKWDERIKAVSHDPVIAGIARQLLGADKVLLMEDNGIVKNPQSKNIPWHQDYSYWPLEQQTTAVTLWLSLGHTDEANGGMQIAPGTHRTGEHLPVAFADDSAFMENRKLPEVPQDPVAAGYDVITYKMTPGEGGFHHPMVWHGSPPNTTDEPRYAFILRYVGAGSIWLGDTRMPYNDVGCEVGEPLSEKHFPLVETAF